MNRPGTGEAKVAGDADPAVPAARQVGRYDLLARIAAGGMAEVYVGRVRGEGGFERLLAIKLMLPNIASDPRFAEMFLDEGRISGHIESPHVVQVHDVGRDPDGTLFIAMELVRGVAMHELVGAVIRAGRVVPVPIAVSLIAQAADGLAAAHEATTPLGQRLEVVHRDVSPQNILIGIDGRARVADFGIARAVHRLTNTATGELKGKLSYFAPEQLRAKPADARSDVFALGVVAWETIAGRRLFQGEHPFETVEQIRVHEPVPLDVVRTDVPQALAAAIARALIKDPDRRTASASAFAAELRAAVTPASATVVAGYAREWAGGSVRALDARIKAALGGAIEVTLVVPAPPEGETSGVVVAGEGGDAYETLVTPPPAHETEAPLTITSARTSQATPRSEPPTDPAKTAVIAPRPAASQPDSPTVHAAPPAIEDATGLLPSRVSARPSAIAGPASRRPIAVALAVAFVLLAGVIAYRVLDRVAAAPASAEELVAEPVLVAPALPSPEVAADVPPVPSVSEDTAEAPAARPAHEPTHDRSSRRGGTSRTAPPRTPAPVGDVTTAVVLDDAPEEPAPVAVEATPPQPPAPDTIPQTRRSTTPGLVQPDEFRASVAPP